jgi:hypothetical protein
MNHDNSNHMYLHYRTYMVYCQETVSHWLLTLLTGRLLQYGLSLPVMLDRPDNSNALGFGHVTMASEPNDETGRDGPTSAIPR